MKTLTEVAPARAPARSEWGLERRPGSETKMTSTPLAMFWTSSKDYQPCRQTAGGVPIAAAIGFRRCIDEGTEQMTQAKSTEENARTQESMHQRNRIAWISQRPEQTHGSRSDQDAGGDRTRPPKDHGLVLGVDIAPRMCRWPGF